LELARSCGITIVAIDDAEITQVRSNLSSQEVDSADPRSDDSRARGVRHPLILLDSYLALRFAVRC
jgi:hypothetical protein